MAETVLFNIAESLLTNLGSTTLAEIASAWGFKSHLEKLTNTMNLIKVVLSDAEDRQWESHAIRCWLNRLKLVVYRADDLFDEVATLAMQRQDMGRTKFSRELRIFFSHSNQIMSAFSISKEIESIMQDLDDIVKDMKDFGFVVRPFEENGLLLRKKREACFFLGEEQVIGRDDDKKAIIDMLLDHNTQGHSVSVVPIVGIGGLGKTTLAHMVYNDDGVKNHFDLRLRVTVSNSFEIEEIAAKILMLATKNTEPQKLDINQLQNQLHATIMGKKYLLVMDDVWNESREKWLMLSALLNKGEEGSKILVTTRSEIVANVMGTFPFYSLKGLSESDSWSLFKNMAFEDGVEPESAKVLEAAHEIVKKCAHVPLAIRTLGSLLYRKDERTWLHFKDRNLSEISGNVDAIMSILKLSYHHLWSPLKNCFAYCALFPKDHEFYKNILISLWMAQGFIIPLYKQSLEDAAEEYFLTLLHRGFFQDVVKDEWGVITGCKMHDLMHDLAQEVAKNECKLANYERMDFDNKILHLSFDKHLSSFERIPHSEHNLKLLRTFLLPCQTIDGSTLNGSMCNRLFSSFRCLRVLDFGGLGIKSLPSSIGELVHLRYLILNLTPIEELPESITKLKNLQRLSLYECHRLKRLPDEFSKLIALRYLKTGKCRRLTHMPPEMGRLTSLQVLQYFVVNKRPTSIFRRKPSTAQLRDLENLNSLTGGLHIKILGEVRNPMYEAEKANLNSKHGLENLVLEWDDQEKRGTNCSEHDETLLEGLKPHPNLKTLKIEKCQGEKLPSWVVNHNLCSSLPNLVEVQLFWCKCEHVPAFSQLPFLKRLNIVGLERVEYMESDLHQATSLLEDETLFFPRLQKLDIQTCPNLKSWWKGGEVSNDDQKKWQEHQSRRSFSKLSILYIIGCPNLKSVPLCPNAEELLLLGVSKNLSVPKIVGSIESHSSSTYNGCGSSLKMLGIGNLEDLISLPNNSLHHLSTLAVVDPNLKSTSKFEDIFTSLSSLHTLRFIECRSLTSISGSFEHLTTLKMLVFYCCAKLDLSTNEGMEEGMPWKAITNLQTLVLIKLPKLEALPNELQRLTNLCRLNIQDNQELSEIPDWITCLSSLQYLLLRSCPKLKSLSEGFRQLTNMRQLQIIECHGLTKRCRGPDGEDWPKIQHIPVVCVLEEALDPES